MKLSDPRKPKWILLLICGAALFFSVEGDQFAQNMMQIPARTGHVNDFAGVVDEKTQLRLENILENVKQKTGIEFDIATVESTSGQDIFDYSRQLAMDWNIGARTSTKKSLLLVLAVKEKVSFTQFSKSVQNDLPEGVLGEMSQRMRSLINSGQFGGGLYTGVQHFVSAMAEKLAVNPAEFDKIPETVSAKPPATDSSLSNSANVTRPRVARPTTPAAPAPPEASPTAVKTPAPIDEKTTTKLTDAEALLADEDESEEVELTLTLPLDARVAKLKAFIDENPDSKSKPRAIEILVSAYAALGDQKLKKGDSAGGVEQLMLAISSAPVTASEKLFSGVISQIPLNLFLRGERAAAAKAAQDIEAKFGGDPKRLLAISAFYVGTEQGSEAARLSTRAVSLAPDMAEAHQGLALALHISLRLDEAAGEYKRALELDPNSKGARRGLADLSRALGKAEEALALYRQQLVAEPTDKAARAGLVLSLLDLGRATEAKSELDTALKADPRNLALLAGAGYWFAAHNDSETALAHGSKAIEIEPRYTWSHVAVARALLAQKKPLEAERVVRFARQYGKFPTLDYELASALVSAGLYNEASEILTLSFSVKDSQIEAQLAGRASARAANFIDLLAPERRASIFQFTAADTEHNARILKALLTFSTLINQADNDGKIDEDGAVAAAKEFASGDDAARVYRQLYAAGRLLQRGVGFQTAYELAEAARTSADAGMSVPALTVAVQADEYREIRARAISSGGTPDIPEAPRNVLANLLRGRIEDLSGWARFNQDRLDEAVAHLKRAVNILPAGTPASRTSLWHLGAALERQDKKEEALANYIKSYNEGDPDSIRRTVIEKLYRKINGSLKGLEEQIGPAQGTVATVQTSQSNNVTTDSNSVPAQTTSSPVKQPTPATLLPVTGGTESAQTSSPEPAATPAAAPSPETPTVTTPTPDPAMRITERTTKPRTNVTVSGQVRDPGNNPITNVVVVLISSQGAVLTSTTDNEGNYSFTLAPSENGYRLIPSRDGFTFEPIDRNLPGVSTDQKRMNFAGSRRPAP
jgi:tetratricopeptide (TPR) repeat protein/uncharacterized membrane protein YgcG